ncbi:MAG: hypothetical protein Q8L29_02975 [archaeon]|nr:hypothetical protein [archaeon]
MNKKGWMRIVEATMAVIIITGFVLTYTAKREKAENDLTFIITPVLEELAEDNAIRNRVLSSNKENIGNIEEEIKGFVGYRITNPSLGYEVKICEIEDVCILGEYPADVMGDIYAVERIISATLDQNIFLPKKVKIFLWRIA